MTITVKSKRPFIELLEFMFHNRLSQLQCEVYAYIIEKKIFNKETKEYILSQRRMSKEQLNNTISFLKNKKLLIPIKRGIFEPLLKINVEDRTLIINFKDES
jgi:hypothetical protein